MMQGEVKCAVTGAFGYSGRYITERLIAQGHRVICLTNSMTRENPFDQDVDRHYYNFANLDQLVASLRGVDYLFNTYWVRFRYQSPRHTVALDNSRRLFEAARLAGVKKIVHLSIANASLDSPLEYFQGKAILERELIKTGVSYAILRPNIMFGGDANLINNIAWVLRHYPVFGVFRHGRYKLQPVHVGDVAKIAVSEAFNEENKIVDVVGPDTFSYIELVRMIAKAIGVRRLVLPCPATMAHMAARLIGRSVHDIVISREEIDGLMANYLYVDTPSLGALTLGQWVQRHAERLGRDYSYGLGQRPFEETMA